MASVTEQLKDLAALHKDGVLTDEEFEEQKRIILAESRARASTPPTNTASTSTTTGTDLTGRRVGEYRLERKLGEGGMGTVYLGAHETLDQKVAVKVLDPALAHNEDVRRRFIQEANIQIQLQHPGIVRVLTAHTQGDHLALVMEYVEGLSLEQALERHGRLPLDKTLHLAKQVLDAVGYAHERGAVHRDLKPSNIMVQPDGRAKVMDFGIAKVLGGAKLTRTGTLMGTAHYMSPEQVLGRSDIDHRTDIYSLGVTFFEALTGRVPFEGTGDENTDSDFLIKQAHVQGAPPDPRSIRPDLPESVARTILRALEKEPGRRFESCGDFGLALGPTSCGQSSPPVPPPPGADLPSKEMVDQEDLGAGGVAGLSGNEVTALTMQLTEALGKIHDAYSKAEVPPPVVFLQGLVDERRFNTVRAQINSIWSDLLKYHRKKGIYISSAVTRGFQQIQMAIRKIPE